LTGKVAGVNPEAFKIIDGKLFLGWSKKGTEEFAENFSENIEKADAAWIKINQEQ
jgi:hypothetical protein